jgi:large subunit ribosomal protein L14
LKSYDGEDDMKGIAGRVMRGLPTGARLECIDNTGAKIVEIVATPKLKGTHRRYPQAGVGDLVIITVKKGAADMRRQLLKAVIVRQKRPFRRSDGTMVQFEDNAAVIVTENGETKGSMIKGPVALEAAERWPRIAANASIIV